jgi:hypothetical protein
MHSLVNTPHEYNGAPLQLSQQLISVDMKFPSEFFSNRIDTLIFIVVHNPTLKKPWQDWEVLH